MAGETFTYARKGHVTFKVKKSGVGGSFVDAGCVVGDLTVNDSMADDPVTPMDDWCTLIAQEGNSPGLAKIKPGERTIEINGTLQVIFDQAFKDMYTDYDNGDEFQVQLDYTHATSKNTPGAHNLTVEGFLQSFNRTGRDGEGGDGTAQWDFNFHANSVIVDSVTTASN